MPYHQETAQLQLEFLENELLVLKKINSFLTENKWQLKKMEPIS